jgi:hypothetical protein
MSTVSVGEAHARGRLIDGAGVCWGDNTFGQTEAPPGQKLGHPPFCELSGAFIGGCPCLFFT